MNNICIICKFKKFKTIWNSKIRIDKSKFSIKKKKFYNAKTAS